MTFVVELKNVTKKPIDLLGVRYGNSYGKAAGKLRTEFFAPNLFEFEFTDENGKPIPRTKRKLLDKQLHLRGALAHSIAPNKTLQVLLRPSRFWAPLQYDLKAGRYKVKVHYRGPDGDLYQLIKKFKPDIPLVMIWSHKVTSNVAEFSVSKESTPPQLVWGPVKDGLQAAMEFRVPENVVGNPTEAPGVSVKTPVGVVFHVKNVGNNPITFMSEIGRQCDEAHVLSVAENKIERSDSILTGFSPDIRWNLIPGEIAKLNVLNPHINNIDQPGQYLVHYTIRFNNRQRKDGQGNIVYPLPNDWQSELETGVTKLFLKKKPINISANGEIHGRLFDDDTGKPIRGATIAYGPMNNVFVKGGGPDSITDSLGNYRLQPPSPGLYYVWLKKIPRNSRATASIDRNILVKAGKVATSELQMLDGRYLTGKVIDESGSPVENIVVHSVSSERPDRRGTQKIRTKKDGSFFFWLAPGQNYIYTFRDIKKTKENPLGNKQTSEINLKIPRKGKVEPIILTLKNEQPKIQKPGKVKNKKPSDHKDFAWGKPLNEAINEFNEKHKNNVIGKGQTPLTIDEVVASISWISSSKQPLELSEKHLLQFREVAGKRTLTNGWRFELVPEIDGINQERFKVWSIRLVFDKENGKQFSHVIRTQHLWQIDAEGKPVKLSKPGAPSPEGTPLAAAIQAFNRKYSSLGGQNQPPLTEQEVVAAIRHWKTKRNESPVNNRDFADFQKIADSRQLPKGVKLELIGKFGRRDGSDFLIWSVRILTPHTTKPGWTFAYGIRKQFVRWEPPVKSDMPWGPFTKKGVQVRLIPDLKYWPEGTSPAFQIEVRIAGKQSLIFPRSIMQLDVEVDGDKYTYGAIKTLAGYTGYSGTGDHKPFKPFSNKLVLDHHWGGDWKFNKQKPLIFKKTNESYIVQKPLPFTPGKHTVRVFISDELVSNPVEIEIVPNHKGPIPLKNEPPEESKPNNKPATEKNTSENKPAAERKQNTAIASKDVTSSDKHFIYTGRVVNSNGKPINGATINVVYSGYQRVKPGSDATEPDHREYAEVKTNTDGKFRVEFDDVWTRSVRERGRRPGNCSSAEGPGTAIVVSAPGHAPEWLSTFDANPDVPLKITLKENSEPIRGRLVNSEGEGMSDVTVSLITLCSAEKGAVDRWIHDLPELRKKGLLPSLKGKKKYNFRSSIGKYPVYMHVIANTPGIPTTVKTDRDGRFQFPHIGADRLAILELKGPKIATHRIAVVTRDMKPIQTRPVSYLNIIDGKHYGVNFAHVTQPRLVIEGIVRDKVTGTPISAKIRLRRRKDSVNRKFVDREWKTDSNGKYHIEGLPNVNGLILKVIPNVDQPYFAEDYDLPKRDGLKPITFDVKLRRGVLFHGKLTDKKTGKPIPNAFFDYFPLLTNKNVVNYLRYQDDGTTITPMDERFKSSEDGSFSVVGIPSEGIIAARFNNPQYLKGIVLEGLDGLVDEGRMRCHDYCFTGTYQSLKLVKFTPGQKGVEINLQADRGESIRFEVVGPDGKPMLGYTIDHVRNRNAKENQSTVYGFHKSRTRTVYFRHREKNLAKAVVISGVPKESIIQKVRLEPMGTVKGQIITEDSLPLSNASFQIHRESILGEKSLPNHGSTTAVRHFVCDKEGKFVLQNMIVGADYKLVITKPDGGIYFLPDVIKVNPGQKIDMGKIKLKKN